MKKLYQVVNDCRVSEIVFEQKRSVRAKGLLEAKMLQDTVDHFA